MAVMRNSIIFGGVDSADYGIYISGEGVFNAPKRDVELVAVPGRNGALALDKGRFENINVTYPAFNFEPDYDAFAQKLSDFRNAICSKRGYQRLTDTFHPDEYRMATYIGGLDIKPIKFNTAAQFDIVFDCQPQRYLLSGEEPIDISEWSDVETKTGETVTIDALGLKSFSTPFEPSQDGTPWITETDEVAPYLFRSMPQVGQDYDSEVLRSIVGGSVAWNQLAQNGNFANSDNITSESGASFSVSNNTLFCTFTEAYKSVIQRAPLINGHKYIHAITAKTNGNGVQVTFGGIGTFLFTETEFTRKETVFNWSSSTTNNMAHSIRAIGTGTTAQAQNYMLIDLTQMFGTTIADYVYSLEQTTAGAGVDWLKSHFPTLFDGYHAYDSGSLKSVKTSAHETVGFNQWDEEVANGYWDTSTGQYVATPATYISSKYKIPVLPNTNYYLKSPAMVIGLAYDSNGNKIPWGGSNYANLYGAFTTPADCYFITFWVAQSSYGSATYNNDICINISGSRNGEYEPYRKRSYALDADLELRGRFYLDANNNLRADGDIYPPSGEVDRRFSEPLDLGTLDWNYNSTYSSFVSSLPLTGKDTPMLCSKYMDVQVWSDFVACDKVLWSAGTSLYIRDSAYNDATAFTTAMLGVYLIYKLAEPTTEQADPYQEVQIVDNYSTEAFVDERDVQIPVGHISRFGEVYAINGWDEIGFSVASGEDQTDYTLDLDGTRYGGEADIISGDVELTWGHTDDYNGETLSGRWLSDRDAYAEGTSPSIGAEVAYELSTPQTVQVTPVEVDLYDGENTLSSNTGKGVTVEYGTPPGMILNPTLFESSPLLVVEGTGDVNIGEDTVTLSNSVIGRVKIADADNYVYHGPDYKLMINESILDESLLNNGDNITFSYSAEIVVNVGSNTPTACRINEVTGGVSASVRVRDSNSIVLNLSMSDITVEKGTDNTINADTYAIVTLNGSTNVNVTAATSVSYRSGESLQVSNQMWIAQTYITVPQGSAEISAVYGDSTVPVSVGQTYIDLDIGEAYVIEDGQVISANGAVTLPSELPTLKPGETEITHDDTITAVTVTPRWWKV